MSPDDFCAPVSMTIWRPSIHGSLSANSWLSKKARRSGGLTKVSGGWSRTARPNPGTKYVLPYRPSWARYGTPLIRGHKPHHGTGVAWPPCQVGKLALLIGLRLGRGPPGFGFSVGRQVVPRVSLANPSCPGGPAALNLASHFSILSAGFVVVTPLHLCRSHKWLFLGGRTPDLLYSTVEVENISLSPPKPARKLLSMHLTTNSTIA